MNELKVEREQSKEYSGHYFVSDYWHTAMVNCLVQSSSTMAASVSTGMGDRISMSIYGDSPSDETLNQGPRRGSFGDSMNFPLGYM